MRFKDSFTEYIIKNSRIKAAECSEEVILIFGRDKGNTKSESIFLNNR